jgi:hypothetical protein
VVILLVLLPLYLAACLPTYSFRASLECPFIRVISRSLGSPWLYNCLLISTSPIFSVPKWLYSPRECLLLFECCFRGGLDYSSVFSYVQVIIVFGFVDFSSRTVAKRNATLFSIPSRLRSSTAVVCVETCFGTSHIPLIRLTDALPAEQLPL